MAGPSAIVSLADVQEWLGLSSSAGDGTRLQQCIDGLTPVVEYVAGPVIQRTVTDVYDAVGSATIMLRTTPVVSVTTVDEFVGRTDFALTSQPLGSTVDNYGWSLDDPTSGLLVRRSSSGNPMPFLGGPRMVRVVYVAGRDVVPDNIKLGMLTLVELNYQPLLQGGRPSFRNSGMALDDMQSGGQYMRGFLVPNYVKEMIAPSRTLPGIA